MNEIIIFGLACFSVGFVLGWFSLITIAFSIMRRFKKPRKPKT